MKISPELQDAFLQLGAVKEFPKRTTLLRAGDVTLMKTDPAWEKLLINLRRSGHRAPCVQGLSAELA